MSTQQQQLQVQLQLQEQSSSIIQQGKLHYNTFLSVIECNLNANKTAETIAKEFPLDVEYNNDRTVLYNIVESKKTVIQEATKICSTRSKNKLNPNKGTGFVKIVYPRTNDEVVYTHPAGLIDIGAYCKLCRMHGPRAHTESCMRPRKSSLYLTIRGVLDFIPRYKNYTLNEIDQKITIDDLSEFKYTKDKDDEQTANASVKESIVKFFSDLIDKKKYHEYQILDNEDYDDGKKRVKKLSLETKTTIPISTVVSLPKKERTGYLPGPIMIRYLNEKGAAVTIRIRVNLSNKECNIELVSNPYEEKSLYQKVIKKINSHDEEDESTIIFKNNVIKSTFSSMSLFTDKTKQLDMAKIMAYMWPDKYNDVRLNKNDEFSYIYLTETSFYRYKPDNKFSTHHNRITLDLIESRNRNGRVESGPNKVKIQLFSQGHFQLIFGYCSNKDKNTNHIPHFRSLTEQFASIHTTVHRIAKEFVNFLIKLDCTQGIILNKISEKYISKKLADTISGTMPYTKRRKFNENETVQIFNYQSMKWSSEIYKIEQVLISTKENSLYRIKARNGTTQDIRHNFLRRDNSSTDQVCRSCEKGVHKQPIPYSFIEPECQNGYDNIVKPFGVVARDNRYYPCPEYIKPKEIDALNKWIYNFGIKGTTSLEHSEHMIAYQQPMRPRSMINKDLIDRKISDLDKLLFEKIPDPLCGTFTPGTTSIDSIIFVEKAHLNKIVSNDTEDNGDGEDYDYEDYNYDEDYGGEDGEDEYDSDEEDDKYIRVKILDKKKSHGTGNDELIVDYTVVKCDSSDKSLYTIVGKYFHPMYIENRNFLGLETLALIDNYKSGNSSTTVTSLLLECFEEYNLIGYQKKSKKNKYGDNLKLVYHEPEKLRRDMYLTVIPHTMNMLTHTYIKITKEKLSINYKTVVLNNNDNEEEGRDMSDFKTTELQCLGYHDYDTICTTFYVIDVINGDKDKYRINTAKNYLEKYKLLNKYKDMGFDIKFKTENHDIDEDRCTKVYIDHSSSGQRYIIPKGICKRNIVLQVLDVEGNCVRLGIDEDKDIMYNTMMKDYKVIVKTGDYVEVKLNLLPIGILRVDREILYPEVVHKKYFLGSEKTENLLNFIMKDAENSIVE